MLAIVMNCTRMRRKGSSSRAQLCCRTCLSKVNLEPIFEVGNGKMAENISEVTGLEVFKNDGLPQHICRTCLISVRNAIKFRRKSLKSIETLLDCKSVKNGNIKLEFADPDNIYEDTKIKEDPYESDNINDYDSVDTVLNDTKIKDSIIKEDIKVKEDIKTKAKRPRAKRAKTKQPSVFTCYVCGKQYTVRPAFNAHMKMHLDYRVCEQCGKKCRNNYTLLQHKRAMHGAEKIHKCRFCEYASANQEGLTIHERRHTGERPYICDHCGSGFHRRSNLVQHIAIHQPDKNFQCDMCNKKMKSRKFLQIHKHNAHTGRRYAYLCQICSRRFDKPNKVRCHMRKTHAAEVQGDIVRVELNSYVTVNHGEVDAGMC